MDILSIIRVALRALTRNKLRSILTMLGIIIGVGAVIAMVAVGNGANEEVQRQMTMKGANELVVQAGSRQAGVVHVGSGATKSLQPRDKDAILKIPGVQSASVLASSRQQVIYENNNWGTGVQGSDPEVWAIRNWTFDLGGSFTEQDITDENNVVVMGNTPYINLFPDGSDPVGKTIRIKNLPFTVVGTLIPKGQSAQGQDQDDNVYIPYTTLIKKITGQNWLNQIFIQAVDKQSVEGVDLQVTSLMRSQHRIRAGQPDDFMVQNLTEMADVADAASSIMTILLASIASVSLMVGGIGIMNIMLVSVTERTREIGIRMAVGATEADVQRQFLVEAMVLSAMGGFVGIAFGAITAWLISSIAHWPVDVSITSILAAALFSAGIGIFFGYYPAQKAARLDPIEALRYE